MKLKNFFIVGIAILLAFISINVIYEKSGLFPKRSINEFSRIVKTGNIDNLTLKIYYMEPNDSTYYYPSAGMIIQNSDLEVVVSGDELKEHVDVLSQLNKDVLVPAEEESYLTNGRLYYTFETKRGRKILEVTMWGKSGSIFVNGLEFEDNDIFYDVIIPFLPEKEAMILEGYPLS